MLNNPTFQTDSHGLSRSAYCSTIHMYPMPPICILQSWQGQLIGFQDFTLLLNSKGVSRSSIFDGRISQILVLNMRCFRNHYALSILKKIFCRELRLFVTFKGNKSLIIVGARPLTTLNISIARKQRFLVCIETKLSLSDWFSKVDTFSL